MLDSLFDFLGKYAFVFKFVSCRELDHPQLSRSQDQQPARILSLQLFFSISGLAPAASLTWSRVDIDLDWDFSPIVQSYALILVSFLDYFLD